MEYQIDIRPFQPEDQEALAGVIRRTWQYDRFCGPKTAQRLGRVYLRQCLTQQTFTRVAVVDGVPVGIIMGKNERTHRCPWSLRWRAARAVLALLATREGRKVARLFSGVERINQALLSRCPQSYPGQVASRPSVSGWDRNLERGPFSSMTTPWPAETGGCGGAGTVV